MKKYVATTLMVAVIMASCKKSTEHINNPGSSHPIAPDGFNFSTTKEVSVDVKLLTNDNAPLKNVLVKFYTINNTKKGDAIFTALTDASGAIKAALNLPSYVDTLLIDPAYIGLLRNAKAPINGNNIQCIIGGPDGYSGDVVPNDNAAGDMQMVIVHQSH